MKAFYLFQVFLFISLITQGQRTIEFHKNNNQKVFSVTEVSQNSLTASFYLSELNFTSFAGDKEDFITLSAPGFGRTYNTGQPDLPIFNQLIVVPWDVKLSVTILNSDEEEDELTQENDRRVLKPAIESISKSQKNPEKIEYIKGKIYSQNSYNDRPCIELREVGIMRDVRLYELVYHPVLYNAVKNKLKVRHQVQVRVDWVGTIPDYKNWNFTNVNAHMIASDAKNNTLGQETFVLVSPTKYKETLLPFVGWKKQQGFHMIEVYIGETIPNSDKNTIKTYLKNLYENPAPGVSKPSYLLLVGDVADIPGWNGTTDNHVTDLYYAEYTGDFLPEVYYGRFSAVTTLQLSTIIEKTLFVEKGSGNQRDYQNEHLLVSGVDPSFASIYGNGAINYFTEYYSNEQNGVNAHYYLYGSGSPVVSNSSQAHQAIIDDFDAGVGIAYYTAHCGTYGWSDPSFEISDIAALTNKNEYPLMIGNCCQSYSYNATSFGEEIVRTANKGAVAYIGASDFSYWDEDYYWGVGFTSNIVAHPTYESTGLGSWDAWFHTHNETVEQQSYTAGQILQVGNLAVQSSTSNLKDYYWEIYGIMGDPSLMPAKYKTQVSEPQFDEILLVGQSTLKVSAPYGSNITLIENGELLAFGKTDGTDYCDLSFEPLQHIGEKQVVVTITHPDFAPFIDSLRVIAPSGPFLVMTEALITDSLGNTIQTADYGGIVGTTFKVKNFGNEEASNVAIELQSESQWIESTSELQSVEVGTIQAGELMIITNPINIHLKNNVPDREVISFKGIIYFSDSLDFDFEFSFTVNAPDLIKTDWVVDQSGVGNSNGIIESGEELTMTVFFTNSGHSQISNTTISFSSLNNELLSVLTENTKLGEFKTSQTKSIDLLLKAGTDFFEGDQVSLKYCISAGEELQYQFKGSITVTLGKEPDILMGTETQEIVTANFYDSGGPNGKYSNNEKDTLTLFPHNAGEGLMIDFNLFEVESSNSGNCWDKLKIFDGASTNSPLLGSFCTANYIKILQSQNDSGALTFLFESDNTTIKNGWEAYIYSSPKNLVNFLITDGLNPLTDVSIFFVNNTMITNEQGVAQFPNTLEDGEKKYTISKPGYFSKTGKIENITSDTNFIFILEKLPEISFTVFDENQPLEGVTITFNDQNLVTNSNGSVIFTSVLPGTKSFRATKTGYTDTIGTVVVGTVNDSYNLYLHLKPTYQVKMVVTDEFGLVSNAKVTINQEIKYTNTDGEIIFDGLYQGNYGYTIEKEGYHKVTGGIDITDTNLVKNVLLNHITFGVNFFITENSLPLANAEISLLNKIIETAANGRVSLYGIIPANNINYTVSKTGYESSVGNFDVVDSDVSIAIELTYVRIDQITENSIQIFPNPASKDVPVKITSNKTIDLIQVFSYHGELLINYSVPTKEYQVDFSKFSKGIYILQTRIGERVFYEKVMVE